MIESSKALDALFYKYTHLPIGGKEIVCPYWMNDLENGIFGPIGGKGTPEQIVEATEEQARKESVDLNSLDESGISVFMKACGIGVDCSGFLFWMLNELDLEKGGNGINDDIPGSTGKTIGARANVAMLTDDKVSYIIKEINDFKVGDMIRIRRAKHIAIITRIVKNGSISEIEYCHSSGIYYTKISGVHSALIQISDPDLGLDKQNWLEKTPEEQSYVVHFRPQTGDGARRLKIWG